MHGSSLVLTLGSLEHMRSLQIFSVFGRYNEYASDDGERTQQLKHFSDAFNRIRTDYVHQTDDKKLLAAAITGIQNMEGNPGALPSAIVAEAALDSMTGALDPHSSYLNPEEFKESQVVYVRGIWGLRH